MFKQNLTCLVKRWVLTPAAMAVATTVATAQNPVDWRAAVEMSGPVEGQVRISAQVRQGWHLYGTDCPEGGPKATLIDFSSSRGIRLVGKPTPSRKPLRQEDEIFSMTLEWWDKEVDFVQKFELTDKENARILVNISYMSCDDKTCSMPLKESLELTVPDFR